MQKKSFRTSVAQFKQIFKDCPLWYTFISACIIIFVHPVGGQEICVQDILFFIIYSKGHITNNVCMNTTEGDEFNRMTMLYYYNNNAIKIIFIKMFYYYYENEKRTL